MQYTFIGLAIAAQVLPIIASPIANSQDVVVTVVKTVTAGGPPPAAATKVANQPKVVTITAGGPNTAAKSQAPASSAAPSSGGNNNDDSQGTSAPDSDSQTIVDLHTKARKCHGAGSMSWDTRLATAASQLAQTCKFAHDTSLNGGNYGQNIALNDGYANAMKAWYNDEMPEFTSYNQASPNMANFEDWGHYTQVVWKASNTLGCATHHCTTATDPATGQTYNNIDYIVCNYGPAGNIRGAYAKNVAQNTC